MLGRLVVLLGPVNFSSAAMLNFQRVLTCQLLQSTTLGTAMKTHYQYISYTQLSTRVPILHRATYEKLTWVNFKSKLVNLCVLLLQVDLPHFLPCTRSEERKKQKKLSRNPRLVECRRISRTEFILKSLSNKTNCTKQGSIKLCLLAIYQHMIYHFYIYIQQSHQYVFFKSPS